MLEMWKNQVWSDTLRLPCVVNHESVKLISGLSPPSLPIPFQSKHLPSLKRNVWFALKRPIDRSKTGVLCIIPEKQLCIFVSGEQPSKKYPTPRVAIINIRVDPQFYEAGKPTVIEATLSGRDRKLWIEDVCQWKGRILEAETFSQRWALAKQWLDHYCMFEADKLGFTIELAPWGRLVDMKSDGMWELMPDEARQRRLRWMSKEKCEPVPLVPTVITTPKGPAVAIATRCTSGPDQWDLTSSDGVSLGRALIRSMQMSTALRSSKNVVRIEVDWQPGFKKWEAKKLTQDSASLNDFFESHKVE
jgi:hypothetical protein